LQHPAKVVVEVFWFLFFIVKAVSGLGCGSVVDCLLSMSQAWSLIPSTEKKKKNPKKQTTKQATPPKHCTLNFTLSNS
jgi:hypothetical protein